MNLGPGSERADLSVQISRPCQAQALAARSSFHRLRAFILDWAAEGEASAVSSLWLEFDVDRERGPTPLPVLCAGLRERVETGWLVGTLLPSLHGSSLTLRQSKLVERCCAAIPPGARLLYAFSLRPRGTNEVRLEVLGLAPDEVLPYLDAAAPETTAPVAAALPLFTGIERLHVSLDIAERISPQIGLEGSFRRLPHREPGWRVFFDRLVARGLCSPSKRAAALAWPGYDSFWSAPELWPRGADRLGLYCIRSLSHVKVVAGPGRQPSAKVYLLIVPFRKPPVPGRPGERRGEA